MPSKIGPPNIRKAYGFLVGVEKDGKSFTEDDLAAASGWQPSTTNAYLSKKLRPFLQPGSAGYKVTGLNQFTEEAFCRWFSQNAALASEPQKPLLEPRVEGLVKKARDAALAAVQHYNNPTASFRSGNFIVLMVIAYTSLFHGIFERKGTSYVVRDKKSGMEKVTSGGEPMLWDALECAQVYDTDPKSPMVANLRFFFPLRHKIEHRFMPQLDPEIAGHCQALLSNFEKILTAEFTDYYSLNASLGVALQFSTKRPPQVVEAMRRLHSAEYAEIKKYIRDFEAGLDDEVIANPAFAFRVWLIPKTAKNARNSDISVEFVALDQLTPEEREEIEQSIVAIRSKEIDVWAHYEMSRNDLAKTLGLTGPKTSALIRELGIRDDPACFRVLTRKKSKFDGFSAEALKRMQAALDGGADINEIWVKRRHEFGAKKSTETLATSK